MGRTLLGVIIGICLVPVAATIWFYTGKVPVAVADPPIPHESEIAGKALARRIGHELIQMPPIQPGENTFIAGARIYVAKCAVCHGFHGKPAQVGADMFPAAPQLWEKHRTGPAVGVSDDAPGETYWKVANGIRLTGMPGFRPELDDNQMWQVSLLLANADKPLPPAVLTLLRGGTLTEPDTLAPVAKALKAAQKSDVP